MGKVSARPESSSAINSADFSPKDIITRDVCVIGGGSSGTYSAIRLRDLGKSVVVVERSDRLGGHTETYTDPATQGKVDIGVVVWHDLDIVRNYFARFNVPLTKANFSIPGVTTEYVDFRTGKIASQYSPSNPAALGGALAAYGAQLAKYPYLEAGFDLSYPVPADLLLPFGDFVKKYSLDAAVSLIFSFAQGLGDLLAQPTLYVMKNFGLDILRNIQVGFLTTERHDNSELYQKARAQLGDDVLLLSEVVATDRNADGGAKILVKTPSGLKLILAKKIVLTIPPKLNNLLGFDLDDTERSLFRHFGNSAYYTGLLRNAGIPPNISFANVGVDTPYNLPVLPGLYGLSQTGIPGLLSVKYGSPVELSEEQVKEDVIESVNRLRMAGTLPTTTPEFAVFASHTPFELTVPTSAIEAGFYKRLYALQGRSRTYYTGAAFHTHDSSLLWQFTETLLPSIAS